MSLKIDARRLLALLVVASFLGAASIPLTYATNCPASGFTITASLTLTGPCTYTGTEGFGLGANGITLNCNGHTISYTGTAYFTDGLWVDPGYVGDTIKNCQLTGAWDGAISAEAVSLLTLTGNSVTGAKYGFYLTYASNVALMGNTATGSGDYGFYLDDVFNGLVTHNTATSSGIDGFHVFNGQGVVFKGNSADSNTGYGYFDNSVGPGTIGLGNTYIGNECNGNTSGGSYDGAALFGPAFLCTPQG
jgi:parallel beta-helix repeat protein